MLKPPSSFLSKQNLVPNMVMTKVQCIRLPGTSQSILILEFRQLSCIKWVQLLAWWILEQVLERHGERIDLVISMRCMG